MDVERTAVPGLGLQANPADLPPVTAAAAALAACGLLTKVLTGWLAARGLGPVARVRAGAALVPRGEFNIVIAGLAVAAGIEPALGPLVVAYVLILAITGPIVARAAEPLARRLFRPRAPGRRPGAGRRGRSPEAPRDPG